MSEAFDYDPEARYDDDSTGDAYVARLGGNAKLVGAETPHNHSDFEASDSTVMSQSDDDENDDTQGNSNSVEPESPVSPQTQAALKAFIPEADDVTTINSSTEEQFTTAYDIIDQIDALVSESPAVLFSRTQVRVERDELLDLLAELKDVLPVQLERASALMREAEHRLENAQSQADAIVNNAQAKSATIINDANAQARFLAGQENVVSIATEQARAILNKAQDKATALTKGANEYTIKSMHDLDEQIVELRHSIKSGLQILQERQRLAEQDLPQLKPEDYPHN